MLKSTVHSSNCFRLREIQSELCTFEAEIHSFVALTDGVSKEVHRYQDYGVSLLLLLYRWGYRVSYLSCSHKRHKLTILHRRFQREGVVDLFVDSSLCLR